MEYSLLQNSFSVNFWKKIPWVLIIVLPMLITLPHLQSSFIGSDFSFPFNRLHDIGSSFLLWSDDYLGDRNFSVTIISLLLAKLSVLVVGFLYASQMYIYATLVMYLASIYLFAKRIREAAKIDWEPSEATDTLIIIFAFISPVIFGYFTNYFTIGIILSTVPIILSLNFLTEFILNKKYWALLVSVLFASLIAHSPSCFFFFGLAMFVLVLMRELKAAVVFGLLFVLLSLIWIIPLVFSFLVQGGLSLSADNIYIDHIFDWYNSSVNIFRNSMFSIYPDNKLFSIIPISLYAILFLVAYLIIFLHFSHNDNSQKNRKLTMLLKAYALAFIIGITFSFGGKYATGNLFIFLWTHVSALHFFKSFTQILNVAFVFFIPVLAGSLALLSKAQYRILSFTLLVPCMFILSYLPRLNSYIPRGTIPTEYSVAQKMVNDDTELSRILMLPENAYEYYNWNDNWDQYVIAQKWFNKPLVYFGVITPVASHIVQPTDNNYSHFFIENNFRYLLVHNDYSEDKFKPREFLFDYSIVDNVYHNEYFDLYRLKDQYFTPRIFADVFTEVAHVSNVQYQVYMPHLTGDTNLTMLESYDSGWKIAPAPIGSACSNGNGASDPANMLMRTALADETHKIVHKYANGWTLNSNAIQQGYSDKYYKVNDDNSIDVCLTVYYRPQAYFYFAAAVSGATLIVVLVNIGFLIYKERYD